MNASNRDLIGILSLRPLLPGVQLLAAEPCTNCGSRGVGEDSQGVFRRGCCSENGEHETTALTVAISDHRFVCLGCAFSPIEAIQQHGVGPGGIRCRNEHARITEVA
jgi:hypothetical protein